MEKGRGVGMENYYGIVSWLIVASVFVECGRVLRSCASVISSD